MNPAQKDPDQPFAPVAENVRPLVAGRWPLMCHRYFLSVVVPITPSTIEPINPVAAIAKVSSGTPTIGRSENVGVSASNDVRRVVSYKSQNIVDLSVPHRSRALFRNLWPNARTVTQKTIVASLVVYSTCQAGIWGKASQTDALWTGVTQSELGKSIASGVTESFNAQLKNVVNFAIANIEGTYDWSGTQRRFEDESIRLGERIAWLQAFISHL